MFLLTQIMRTLYDSHVRSQSRLAQNTEAMSGSRTSATLPQAPTRAAMKEATVRSTTPLYRDMDATRLNQDDEAFSEVSLYDEDEESQGQISRGASRGCQHDPRRNTVHDLHIGAPVRVCISKTLRTWLQIMSYSQSIYPQPKSLRGVLGLHHCNLSSPAAGN